MDRVLLTLTVSMRTDRDPWEMAEALAAFLESALTDENPEQRDNIDVSVESADRA